jgi:ectoine hydroxylase-related dioxygenase (phytanoyl-CoA dioxygenase family)
MPQALEKVDASIDPVDLANILRRDGAAIVEGALTKAQLDGLNSDLDDVVAATGPGLRNPTGDFYVDFYGSKTVRLDGLPAKSKAFVDLMLSPLMTGLADELLLPNCEDYVLNTGQLIQIGPGESAQLLHRDEDAWAYLKPPKAQLQVEAMFALTDFTVANGATQVVPGSHLWPPEREAKPEEVLRAEMKAGSALVYLGTTMHGGGANTTADEWRRGMFFGYVVGWLRTEENTFLTVPIDAVRDMPERVQELLGYKAHSGIGVVDVGSPMALLK